MINILTVLNSKVWDEAVIKLKAKIEEKINNKKRILLLLSGGSAVSIYQQFASDIYKMQIKADDLAVAQIDERFQPVNPNDVNANKIDSSGLTEALRVKAIPFYKIPQTGEMREAAFNYDQLLKKLSGIYDYTIAVLGLGSDGHTAGILRGYKDEWQKDRVVVAYENRGEYPRRITVTPKAFDFFDYGLVAVSGIEKLAAVERIINKGSNDINNLPGLLIHKIKEVDLITDLNPQIS